MLARSFLAPHPDDVVFLTLHAFLLLLSSSDDSAVRMAHSTDIVLCIDSSTSMGGSFRKVRAIATSICDSAFAPGHNNRVALVAFHSMGDRRPLSAQGFAQHQAQVQHWFDANKPNGNSTDSNKAVGDALALARDLPWREDASVGKLVVLFTDDAPIGLVTPLVGSDPWKVSDLFRQEEIILVVVGVERSIAPFEEFYWALTEKTGGMYIPCKCVASTNPNEFLGLLLMNRRADEPCNCAAVIIPDIIATTVQQGYTLGQAFRQADKIDIEETFDWNNGKVEEHPLAHAMIKECRAIGDIRPKFFPYLPQHP